MLRSKGLPLSDWEEKQATGWGRKKETTLCTEWGEALEQFRGKKNYDLEVLKGQLD